MRPCDFLEDNVILNYNETEYVVINFFRSWNCHILVGTPKEQYEKDEIEDIDLVFFELDKNESGEDELYFIDDEETVEALTDMILDLNNFLNYCTKEQEISAIRAVDEDGKLVGTLVVLKTYILDNRKFNVVAFADCIEASYVYEVLNYRKNDDDPEFDEEWRLVAE